ncbi:MAG: hypothetical protein QOH24_1229, partial [Verrucomicrobiota bacterium]
MSAREFTRAHPLGTERIEIRGN